jgi:tetraprenyl-beta-curcumene synthase
VSIAIDTNNGHAPPHILRAAVAVEEPPRPLAQAAKHLQLPYAFADTVLRYLLLVSPSVTRELSSWRAQAGNIPNPNLRRYALEALRKRGNIEGAALFATLAPAAYRRRTVRAVVAFQTAYNYLDALSEQPSDDPVLNGDQLHQALLRALCPGAAHPDYYAHNPDRGDGGYLTAILDACSDAVAELPSYAALAPTTREAAARIVDFQALNLTEDQGGHEALERWATDLTPAHSGLEWWETAAAAGSSLAVHALIAAAAHPRLEESDARDLDCAYFPWIGGLHSLLDSLVDRSEDHDKGQRSLLDYYRSPTDAAIRLAGLATRARGATESLPDAHAHRVIVTAMCSYYLSAPQCDTREARMISNRLTEAFGLPLSVAILMFRSRRLLHTLTHRTYT